MGLWAFRFAVQAFFARYLIEETGCVFHLQYHLTVEKHKRNEFHIVLATTVHGLLDSVPIANAVRISTRFAETCVYARHTDALAHDPIVELGEIDKSDFSGGSLPFMKLRCTAYNAVQNTNQFMQIFPYKLINEIQLS